METVDKSNNVYDSTNSFEINPDKIPEQTQYYLEKKHPNLWKILSICLLIIIIFTPFFSQPNFRTYFTTLFENTNGLVADIRTLISKNSETSPASLQPSVSVTPTKSGSDAPILSEVAQKKYKALSNQLFIEGVSFTYPDNWEIVFSNEAFYFSKDKAQTQELLKCVSENSCTNYPLKISGKKISINESIIPTNNLTPTMIGGQTAFLGYSNPEEENVHSTIFNSSEIRMSIISENSSPDNSMLKEFVANIPKATVEKYEPAKSSGKLLAKAAFIEISSSIETNNKDLLHTILKNTLSPKNLTESYKYLLHTKTLKKYRQGPDYWSPDQPESNFLNNSYALSTNNLSLSFGLYETPQIKINVSSGPTNLNLYLSSNKYCETNSDCFYSSSGCRIGAFNQYSELSYLAFGCGAPEFEGVDNQIDYHSKLGCNYDGEEVLIKYDTLSCISNSCQAINASPACFKTIK